MSQMAPYEATDQGAHRSASVGARARQAGPTGDLSLLQLIQRGAIGAALVVETMLLLISLVPANTWTSIGQPPEGPLPSSFSWLVAGIFYVLPPLIGALCRRWQIAVVLATLPAWLDLGVFAVAAASRVGPFYLAQDIHAPNTVGTLELFAVLGALGWLARTAALLVLADRGQRKGMSH
jgi:hypothetical protein